MGREKRGDGSKDHLEGPDVQRWEILKWDYFNGNEKVHWGTSAYVHWSAFNICIEFRLTLSSRACFFLDVQTDVQKRKEQLFVISLHTTVHSSASPAMSTANKQAQSSSDLPVRQGALNAEEIRAECRQFRILIIGKANAGKTTILRKVCNAKPDAKPIICDAKGKEVKVRLEKFAVLAKTN
jgi:hypothetical protein